MKTLNIDAQNSLLGISNQNSNNAKLKKGDIITGLVESVDNGVCSINFKNVNKKISMNVSNFATDIVCGNEYDFEVGNVSKDKIELKMLGLDNMLTNEDVLNSTSGISSKDVFESYGFIEDEDKEVDNSDTEPEDKDLKTIARNAYEENIKKLINHDNFNIFKISLHEFVDMIVEYNNDKLAGIESADSNLVKSLIDNKFENDNDEIKIPKELSDELSLSMEKIEELSNASQEIKDKACLNIFKNNEVVSLNNINKALHEVIKNTNKIDFDINDFDQEIDKVLSMNDVEINDSNKKYARLLIENEIDVTKENIDRLCSIDKNVNNISKEDVVLKELNNYVYGVDSGDLCLEDDETLDRIVKGVTDTIEYVVNDDDVLSEVTREFNDIKRTSLAKINEFINRLTTTSEKQNTALMENNKKILNKMRLMLTAKSAFKMYSKGINIMLEPIKTVCDNLKEIQNDEQTLINSAKLNTLNDELSSLTVRNLGIYTDDLKVNALHSIEYYSNRNIELMSESKVNVTNMSKVTSQMIDDIYSSNMIESHYTLNGEHSITQRNISEILDMLNIENSDINQKCGIILSLSNNEISQENIDKIKSAEEKVGYVLNKLTPKVALSIIEDGIDVSKESIDTVIELIDAKIKALKVNDDNKVKLDLKDNINNAEELYDSLTDVIISKRIPDEVKDALLGLYKVINKVNKYSDAGLGILNYESDEETNRINLSLRDIFDATKTLERKQYGDVINKTIDDAFSGIEVIALNDRNTKELLDSSFEKIREKIERANAKNLESLSNEVKNDLEFASNNVEVLETIYQKQSDITLEQISNVREFEESKTLLKDNVLVSEILSNNEELRNDVDKISRKMKNETFVDDDEDEHLYVLRKERNEEVKTILDEYVASTTDKTETIDVTKKILESHQDMLNRIDSINKVLKLTEETNNAIQSSVYINDELTNINIYFDSNIDLNQSENSMVVSMTTNNLGDIKADVRINNDNKTLRINYLINQDVSTSIMNAMREIENTFSNGYKLIDVTVNGKHLVKNNDNNLYIKSMNIKNKLSQVEI